MSMTIEEILWNSDGELAEQRLRARGIVKYSSDQYIKEFKEVQRERRELEAQRRETVNGYIRGTQEAGVKSYAQATQAVCSNLTICRERRYGPTPVSQRVELRQVGGYRQDQYRHGVVYHEAVA